jgi:large subunit ribosomal protein L21
MYAVVSTGGKQYRVEPGTQLSVERLEAEPGASVTFDRVLLVGDGDQVTVGTPTIDGALVTATVLGEERGPKLVIFKFKQKVKYRRRTGHRQHLTRVRVDRIDAAGRSATREEEAETAPATSEVAAEAPAKPARRSRTKAAATETAAPEPAATTEAAAESTSSEPAEKPKRTRRSAAAKADAKAEE